MNRRLIIRPEAETDLTDVVVWYDSRGGKPIDAGHVRHADGGESIVDALERLEISETNED
jgi:hypothetical protein